MRTLYFQRGVDRIAPELAKTLRRGERVCLAIGGEVIRSETAIAPHVRVEAAAAAAARELAEQFGGDASSYLVSQVRGGYPGCRLAYSLLAWFDRSQVENLRDELRVFGVRVVGVVNPLLAMFAATKPSRAQVTVILDETCGLLIPPARSGNAGPHPLSLGMRQFRENPEAAEEKLRKSLRGFDAETALVRLNTTMMKSPSGPANTFRNPSGLINPFSSEPLFPVGYSLAAALAVIALPFVYEGISVLANVHATAKRELAARSYLVLESDIRKGGERKDAAEKELADARFSFNSRVNDRKPMNAFINLAYFFASHRGRTVLDSMTGSGKATTVAGSCPDPEEIALLLHDLEIYGAEHALRLDREGSKTGDGEFTVRVENE